MRLIAFFAAVAVLFALADQSAAQSPYAVADVGFALARTAPLTAQGAGLRLLTWPGKVVPQARPAAPRWLAATPSASSVRAPTPPLVQPVAQPRPPVLPTSIYAPPARPATVPAPAPEPRQAIAQAGPAPGQYPSPRFYSVHREYGQAPDPIPLSPQFFASETPDLAQPPPPPPRQVTTSDGKVVRTTSDASVGD